MLQVRKTTIEDITEVMQIYADGREIMCESGNKEQWQGNYPPQIMVEDDIKKGLSYVCESENGLVAVFFFSTEPDPTYAKIEGAWLNDEKYGVIHRIARKKNANAKGVGAFCLKWCFEQISNIRIDTHEANAPMRILLQNLGFSYCGIIWLDNGEERMAFHGLKSSI